MRFWPCILSLILATLALAEPIVGRALITEGDTVTICARIRLHGIDTPEGAQPRMDAADKACSCGQIPALALRFAAAEDAEGPDYEIEEDKFGLSIRIEDESFSVKRVDPSELLAYITAFN